ncbi:TraB domain-containing protein, partial [Pseudolycoriella hygida]
LDMVLEKLARYFRDVLASPGRAESDVEKASAPLIQPTFWEISKIHKLMVDLTILIKIQQQRMMSFTLNVDTPPTNRSINFEESSLGNKDLLLKMCKGNVLSSSCKGNVPSSSQQIKIYETTEEFNQNLPPTVTLLRNQYGCKVYVVGTAHYSLESQNDVALVIRNVKPDVIMYELCMGRGYIATGDEEELFQQCGAPMTLSQMKLVFGKYGYTMFSIIYVLMMRMNSMLTRRLGRAPGGEFRRAHQEAAKLGEEVAEYFGDRLLDITLSRAIYGLTLWQSLKLMCRLIFCNKQVSEYEVDAYRTNDFADEYAKVASGCPSFHDAFVTERDLFLCHTLQGLAVPVYTRTGARPLTVVGVVGIGHIDGIKNIWRKVDEKQLKGLDTVRGPTLSVRMFEMTVKAGVLFLAAYGLHKISQIGKMEFGSITIRFI